MSCPSNLPSFSPPLVVDISLQSENARIPTRGTAGSAGYDLFSAQSLIIEPRGKALIPTDVVVEIPPGWFGRIAPRSGLSWRHHTITSGGTIDSDYRGTLGVILFNLGESTLHIEKHDRIAQLILQPCATPELRVRETLTTTERGNGGFGSTGV